MEEEEPIKKEEHEKPELVSGFRPIEQGSSAPVPKLTVKEAEQQDEPHPESVSRSLFSIDLCHANGYMPQNVRWCE